MGFLTTGATLPWAKAKDLADYIRKHGVEQFLAIYKNTHLRTNDALLWGDEIEYLLVVVDSSKKTVKLSLRAHEVLDKLAELEKENPTVAAWRPEYGDFMIEGTPGEPFGKNLWQDLLAIEKNMVVRRQIVTSLLKPDERIVTLVNFPLLGVPNSTEPSGPLHGEVADSAFVPDNLINPHKRFATLTQNIRERKGSHVAINIPLYKDTNTLPLKYDDLRAQGRDALDDHIYMDAMAFGMGMCCLQTTFQACNVFEARHFYDQLNVLSPIMLAITAANPILRGYLADTDCRWQIISASVDDRTPQELGKEPLTTAKRVINKSRYDSIDCYLSLDATHKPHYDDLKLVYDEDLYKHLLAQSIDEPLAKHIAHLFIRDPLVIYEDKVELDDAHVSDHFENIQTTNWQTVRFKPPPPGSPIGWRVEFRPLEVGITDFENAAFVVFIVLMTRVIPAFDLNLYLPISKVDENMNRAHQRDAIHTQKFFFRKNVTALSNANTVKECVKYRPSASAAKEATVEDEYEEMTIAEIMNGKADKSFPGLITLMREYIAAVAPQNRIEIEKYLTFISHRASGELLTTATWMRQFVQKHPAYKHDSVVSQEIAYDLVEISNKIAIGQVKVPELLGSFV